MPKRKGTLQQAVSSYIGFGTSIGVGTAVVARAGGTSVLPAFATAGSMMGPIGTAMMAGHVLKPLKKLRR